MERARLQYPGNDRCGARATVEKQSERKLEIEWLTAEL